MLDEKIPNVEPLEIYEDNNFIDSEFIEIHDSKKIVVDLQYPKLGMKNSINRCFLRKEAYERLLKACNYLPQGIGFKILDAYRPWNLQNELYYAYKPIIIEQFNLEGLPEEEQNKTISKYVSIPSRNELVPPLHTTGGSIDLSLIDLTTGKELDLGIKFDEFSDKTNSDAYENTDNEEVKKNRRILYNAMTKAGFTNLPSEIWHYDFGDRAWAFYKKQPAIYKGVFNVEDIKIID